MSWYPFDTPHDVITASRKSKSWPVHIKKEQQLASSEVMISSCGNFGHSPTMHVNSATRSAHNCSILTWHSLSTSPRASWWLSNTSCNSTNPSLIALAPAEACWGRLPVRLASAMCRGQLQGLPNRLAHSCSSPGHTSSLAKVLHLGVGQTNESQRQPRRKLVKQR
jgi:hypothetical protein